MDKSALERLRQNHARICRNIETACKRVGRAPEEVTLVAVTKTVSAEVVNALSELSITHIGENRVHEAVEKARAVRASFTWHMIGHLQTNKMKKALDVFHVVHSLERESLAQELQKELERRNRTLEVFVQVNVSGEETKDGLQPERLPDFVAWLKQNCTRLHIQGLMTMAPQVDNPEKAWACFRALRSLRDQVGLPYLSMGMSQDYAVAIEEGATHIRLGTALFQGVSNAS